MNKKLINNLLEEIEAMEVITELELTEGDDTIGLYIDKTSDKFRLKMLEVVISYNQDIIFQDAFYHDDTNAILAEIYKQLLSSNVLT